MLQKHPGPLFSTTSQHSVRHAQSHACRHTHSSQLLTLHASTRTATVVLGATATCICMYCPPAAVGHILDSMHGLVLMQLRKNQLLYLPTQHTRREKVPAASFSAAAMVCWHKW